MLTENLDHPKYRTDIDGLRAIAVLSVIGFHVFPQWIKGGFIGVDIFFVISGFLISTIIFGSLQNNSFTYQEFYRRRVRRIFPALVVVLLTSLGVGWFGLLASDYLELAQHTLGGTNFVSNFVLWRESGYFDTNAETKPLLHLWSLAIEEQFYILWPLLLGWVWKRKWNFFIVTSVVALLSFSVNVLSFPEHATAAFYSPLSRFWELMIGGVLAYVVLSKPGLTVRYRNAQSTAGLMLLCIGLVFITSANAFPSWWALLPTMGSALLIAAGQGAYFNRTVHSNKVLVWFGKISYPLYLWHWPLLSFALVLNNEEATSRIVRIGVVLLSIVLAWFTYKFVEKPIRTNSKISTRKLIGAFCFVTALAGAASLLDGVPQRAVNRDEAKVFPDQYKKLHRFGLSEYYMEQCDFYDWHTRGNKGAIDKACTAVSGNRQVFLLWGDSHAQALSFGFRQNISPETQLALIATSGCKPKLNDDTNNGANKPACSASNKFAVEFIKKNKPARVFVAQSEKHDLTNWHEMALFVQANNGELVLIGPVPQWRPSLPIIVAKDLKAKRDYVEDGLDVTAIATNKGLQNTYFGTDVRYVSLIDGLCRANECRAKVPTSDSFDLLALDYGHLTPAGSDFVVRALLKDLLRPVSRVDPVGQ
jgi:peptidoglycan/LPS O-acetylase OafA/YrhL